MSVYLSLNSFLNSPISESAFNAFAFLASQGLNVGIVIGPLVGFIAQYNLIKKVKSVGSFSTDVCAILIFANILRIFFWMDRRFETSLLLQSILMILMQIQLLRLCLNINKRSSIMKQKEITFFSNPIVSFWRWTKVESYLASIAFFILATTLACMTFNDQPLFWEFVGFLSCAIESTLGMPQALRNQTQKSVKGLSYTMILSWFGGDAFKTFYFIVKQQPFQFVMCGIIQLTVDIIIMIQIALFRNKVKELDDL